MKLYEFRKKENNLTQGALAIILTKHGYKCTQRVISFVENGDRKPTYEMMVAFKKAFPQEKVDDWFF